MKIVKRDGDKKSPCRTPLVEPICGLIIDPHVCMILTIKALIDLQK